MAQCFSFAKEENIVQRCVAFGCSNTKDEIKGFSIHQIPFYGDTRSEAVKRRGKWISFVNGNRKHWTPSKYSGALLGAFRTRRLIFDFAPFLEYVEEIYQMHMEAESSKFLDVAAAHRKVARERRQAKQKMTVATIIFNIN